MEYLNMIDFCSSSSIWLRITFVIMFLYCSVRLSKFIWGLRFKTRRRHNRKKNRARKKHIPDVSVATDPHSQPDVSVATDPQSQPDVSVANGSQPDVSVATDPHSQPDVSVANGSQPDVSVATDPHSQPDVSVANGSQPDVSVATDPHSQPDVSVANGSQPDVSVATDSHSQSEEDMHSQSEEDMSSEDEPLLEFPVQSLVDATKKFALDLRISVDGLGSVFKGKLKNTEEVFIIRRLNEGSLLTPEEFEDEVSFLSQANHQYLTKLIGYSVRFYKRFLVYEYVSGGTLESHLYGNSKCLDWETRMKIVVGVAEALRYLHKEMETPILHCYIHPSNIWLDENCNPKLSAYGVVRLYYPAESNMFSSCMIGSYYYTIHDHRLTGKVTIEADIYGFGIFLLEIITGRKGCIIREDGVAEYLIDWVQPYLKDKQKLAEIVDSRLGGNFKEEELYEVCNIAEMCLKKQPSDRPPMADLVTRMSPLAE